MNKYVEAKRNAWDKIQKHFNIHPSIAEDEESIRFISNVFDELIDKSRI